MLFSLHSTDREDHFHDALGTVASRCPIATTVRPAVPTGAVWALVGHDPHQRRRLADLNSDHGPGHPRNPNWHAGRLHLDDTPL